MYTIEHDPTENLLKLTLTGLWTPEILDAFNRAFQAAAAAALKTHGTLRILSDSRAFPVQTGEISEGLAASSRTGATAPVRTAIVVGSTLSKLQATRTLACDHIRVFLDMDEARLWLTSAQACHSAA